jgi:hypothetical protein
MSFFAKFEKISVVFSRQTSQKVALFRHGGKSDGGKNRPLSAREGYGYAGLKRSCDFWNSEVAVRS